MDPVVLYPSSYQVTQRYTAQDIYHINCLAIAYSDICNRQQYPFNIFLQLHTQNFVSVSISRSISHITAYTSIYIQYHLLVIVLCNCILRNFYWCYFLVVNSCNYILIDLHLVSFTSTLVSYGYSLVIYSFYVQFHHSTRSVSSGWSPIFKSNRLK